MFRLLDDAYKGEKDGRVVLGNGNNGLWVNISKETFRKIKDSIERNDNNFLIQKCEPLIRAGILTEEQKNEDSLETLMIAITNRCNLRCLHCGFEAGPNVENELDTQEVIKIIENNLYLKEITITGGEPLVHPGFFEISNYLKCQFNGKKILMTNATLINECNVAKIADAYDEISISIDGAQEESCDLMRGKGTFQRVMEAISLLKEVGKEEISLSMTLTDINLYEEETFKKLCRKLHVQPMIRDLFSVGRAKKNKKILEIERTDVPINITRDELMEECKRIKVNGKCSAGRKSIYLQYDGSIYPCPVAAVRTEFKMASLNSTQYELKSIVDDKANCGYKKFAAISPKKIQKCKECDVNDFCWGCLQEYYTFVENDANFKTFCERQKKNLSQAIWRN